MLRTLDNPADLTRYLSLKAQRRALDAEITTLEPVIYSALLDEDGSTADAALDGTGYTLAVRTRRTWDYSPAVNSLADELKALRRYEEKARIAECVKAAGYVVVTKSRGSEAGPTAPLARAA